MLARRAASPASVATAVRDLPTPSRLVLEALMLLDEPPVELLVELSTPPPETGQVEQALADLAGGSVTSTPAVIPATTTAPVVESKAMPTGDPRLDAIRNHLKRYRELSAQGKWAEAGKELEAVEAAARP